MKAEKRARFVLLDSLLVVILMGVFVLDSGGLGRDTHGLWFVLGLLCLVGMVIADAATAKVFHADVVPAVVALSVLPAFEMGGGGANPSTYTFIVAVSIALYFGGKTFRMRDRLQGITALLLTFWALIIGLSNVIDLKGYTGFWVIERS